MLPSFGGGVDECWIFWSITGISPDMHTRIKFHLFVRILFTSNNLRYYVDCHSIYASNKCEYGP